MVCALKMGGVGRKKGKVIIYQHLFCFLDLKIPLCSRCFPVSAFSVSGQADVAAARAITLICSTGEEKKNTLKNLFFLPLPEKISHLALFWACQQKR